MSYKSEINKKILDSYTDILCEVICIYHKHNKKITKKEILSELPSLREFKNEEVNFIFNNALKLVKKYNIDLTQLESE